MKFLAILPALFGTLAAANDAVTHDTPFSFALLIGGVATSLALAWWARGERDKIRMLLREVVDLKTLVKNLYCVRHRLDGCVRGAETDDEQGEQR